MKEGKKAVKRSMAFFLTVSLVFAGSLPTWAENGTGSAKEENTSHESSLTEDNASQQGDAIDDEYIVWYDGFFEQDSAQKIRKSKSKNAADTADKQISLLMAQPEIQAVEADTDTEGSAGLALIKVDSSLSDEEEKDFIDELASEPGVKAVEKNYSVHTFVEPASDSDADAAAGGYSSILAGVTSDAYADQQYALTSVRADEAWNMIDYKTAATVRVAVVDSGVDATHPDLQGKILDGYNYVEYDSSGRKYSTDDASDDNGHGTHVAGIIAAVSNNSMGISGVTGALDVQILPVKVLDDEGNGTTYDVVKGIKYAADNGADFINLSLGSNYASAVEEAAVDYALSKGSLCIAASGNDGADVSTSFPAAYDNVMAIGSIDSQDERSYFSNYGQGLDLTAPGSAILSTVPERCAAALQAEGRKVFGNSREGYYAILSGTSMATPCATGVAVIYKAVNPSADCTDIRQHLNETARDIGDIGFDVYTGNGCIDAAAALGEPIKRIAVRMKSPKSGDEIYEKTSIHFQVNTNLNIDHVDLYMNEISDSKKIAEIDVSDGQSLYDYVLDTTKYEDGAYTFILQSYTADGTHVGEPASSTGVQILNAIPDGFVVEARDPKGSPSNEAIVEIYGISKATSKYELIYSSTTTDLGYDRIKDTDPDNEYSSYSMRITGSYGSGSSMSYYSYRMDDIKPGSRVVADATSAAARKTGFSMKGTDGNEVNEPYLLLAPIEGGSESSQGQELNDMPVWMIYSGSEIYLSEGDYHYETYWSPAMSVSPDYSKPGYYLSGTMSVSGSGSVINADYHDAGILRCKVEDGFDGILQASIALNDRIPFLPAGYIRGKVLYLTPQKYDVKGIVSREIDGETWSVVLQKNDTYAVSKGSDETIEFSAKVGLTKFEPAQNSLRTDSDGTQYIYRGDIFRTVNEMSVGGDTVISGFSGDYPTFSVYRVMDDGTEQLAYQVTDTWQARASTWDSERLSVSTGAVPEAGHYRAKLTFNAGPLGGLSEKYIDFELRNRSGSDEIDSVLTMGSDTTLPRAEMTLFRWDDEAQSWVNALNGGGSIKYSDNSRATLVENNITLNKDGINAAVIKYTHKKRGTDPSEVYNGFQIYYYESVDDLKDIVLSDALKRTVIGITDNYGNSATNSVKYANIGLSSSGNGKLTDSRALTEIELPVGAVYIPEGMYEYVYANFRMHNDEYFLIKYDASTASGNITLDGTQTKKVTVEIPDDMQGAVIYPDMMSKDESSAPGLDFTDKAEFYLSDGTYSPYVELQTADASQQITVNVHEFELNADRKIVISGDFSAAIELSQTIVNKKQNITGNVKIEDSNGNRLVNIAAKNGAIYEATSPQAVAGADGTAGKQLSGVSYTELKITPEYYDGSGDHFVRFTCAPAGRVISAEARFTVSDDSSHQSGITLVESDAYDITTENGQACAVIRSGKDGYRVVTAEIQQSSAEQQITFTLIRGGAQIASAGINDIFDETNNTYRTGFSVKAGDKIIITSRLS